MTTFSRDGTALLAYRKIFTGILFGLKPGFASGNLPYGMARSGVIDWLQASCIEQREA